MGHMRMKFGITEWQIIKFLTLLFLIILLFKQGLLQNPTMGRWYQIILFAMNYHYRAFCFFDTLNIIEMLVQKECQKAASDLGGSLLYGGVGTYEYQRPRFMLSRQQARRPLPIDLPNTITSQLLNPRPPLATGRVAFSNTILAQCLIYFGVVEYFFFKLAFPSII